MPVEVQRLIATLEAKIDKYEKSLAKASGTTDRTFRKIETRGDMMQRRLAAVGQNIFRPLAAGALAAVGPLALFSETMRTVSEASNIAKVADKIGLTTDQLQQLRFAAELTGVSINQLDQGMQRFSRRTAEAASGAGELLPILKANNVQLRDAQGNVRPQIDILRDYADLIRNAGSEQEQLLLAFKAFDSEGAALVNTFRGGAAAIDAMQRQAADAGGVIDEKLIRKAETVEDRFSKLARTFNISWKSALLDIAITSEEVFDRLGSAIESSGVMQAVRHIQTANAAGAAFGAYAAAQMRVGGPDPRVGASTDMAAQMRIAARINGAFNAPTAGKRTIIPSRDDKTAAALKEADAVMQLIDSLKIEKSLIGDTELARQRANAIRLAGSAATESQKKQIIELVDAIYAENEALQETDARVAAINSIGRDALGGFIDDLRNGTTAAEAFNNVLNRMIDKLLEASLNGIFDTNGIIGGFVNQLLGGSGANFKPTPGVGLFARGGVTDRPAVFGDAGPEAAVPLPDGRRIPVDLRMATVPNNPSGANMAGRQLVDVRVSGVFVDDKGVVSAKINETIVRAAPAIAHAGSDVAMNRLARGDADATMRGLYGVNRQSTVLG